MERKNLSNMDFLGKVLVTLGLISFLVILIAGCGGNKIINQSNSVDQNPKTFKSWKDFPPQILTTEEARKAGVFRVIGLSADGQSEYDALTSARLVAQAEILELIQGIKIDKNVEVKTEEGKDFRGYTARGGRLTNEEIKGNVVGYLKPHECGSFYDSTIGRGYYCVEMVFGR